MGAEARLKELGLELPATPNADRELRHGRPLGQPAVPLRPRTAEGRARPLSGHGRPRPHDRAGTGSGAPDGPEPPGLGPGRSRQPRPRAAGRQALWNGPVPRGLRRPPEGDQRLLRPHGRGLRRPRPAHPLGDRRGLTSLGIAVEVEMILEVSEAAKGPGSAPRRRIIAPAKRGSPPPAGRAPALGATNARRPLPTAPASEGPARRHRARAPAGPVRPGPARGRPALRLRARSRARGSAGVRGPRRPVGVARGRPKGAPPGHPERTGLGLRDRRAARAVPLRRPDRLRRDRDA